MNPPRFHTDWEGLAETIEQLHADRIASDPRSVQAGKLTPDQAADRARILGAAVAIWRAVVRREPVPELQACHAEIRADLADLRARLSAIAAANPANTSFATRLEAIVALEWNHRPWAPGYDLPHILFLHGCNQQARAERATRVPPPAVPANSNPGGYHVKRSAERAPLATGGRHSVAAPTSQQAALF